MALVVPDPDRLVELMLSPCFAGGAVQKLTVLIMKFGALAQVTCPKMPTAP